MIDTVERIASIASIATNARITPIAVQTSKYL